MNEKLVLLTRAIEQAKEIGHEMGHIFNNEICFCKKCNRLMYIDRYNHRLSVNGNWNNPCIK